LTGIKARRAILRHECCRGLVAFVPTSGVSSPKLGGAHGAAVLFMGMEQSLVSWSAPEFGYEHTGEL
jgi:hypothetical protein